jgi:hypothetical protein
MANGAIGHACSMPRAMWDLLDSRQMTGTLQCDQDGILSLPRSSRFSIGVACYKNDNVKRCNRYMCFIPFIAVILLENISDTLGPFIWIIGTVLFIFEIFYAELCLYVISD